MIAGMVGVLRRHDRRLRRDAQRSQLHRLRRKLCSRSAYDSTGGWLGFTDKYWAAALIPDQTLGAHRHASSTCKQNGRDVYQTDYLAKDAVTVSAWRARRPIRTSLFAGAKVVQTIKAIGDEIQDRPLRPDDRLGLVLFPDQADVLACSSCIKAWSAISASPSCSSPCSSSSCSSRSPTSPTPR